MQIIPAIDWLRGSVVRLKQGSFSRVTTYKFDPVKIAKKYELKGANRLHLVNLDGSKTGKISSKFLNLITRITKKTRLKVQVGGGIRTLDDMDGLLIAGAEKLVIGSLLFKDLSLVQSAIDLYGSDKFIAALDVSKGKICISGWQEKTSIPLSLGLKKVRDLGIKEVLITDIAKDGMEEGPNVALYKEVVTKFPKLKIIASGGAAQARDIYRLKEIGLDSAVVGKALLKDESKLPKMIQAATSDLAIRIIPCLDVTGGRTVKGTKFKALRDAGDPVELAKRYCSQGADELVFLDISATNQERETVYELATKVAGAINIPFTIGGGVNSVQSARKLLEAGADKVAINSAAVKAPNLLKEISTALGSANTMCAIDAKRKGKSWVVLVNGGKKETKKDAVKWAAEAVAKGAGELLVTSFDKDGTKSGYDIELLKAIKRAVNVPVIASGGAGELKDFVEAAEEGGADALLAASVFHFGKFTVKTVKKALKAAYLPVRL